MKCPAYITCRVSIPGRFAKPEILTADIHQKSAAFPGFIQPIYSEFRADIRRISGYQVMHTEDFGNLPGTEMGQVIQHRNFT